MKITKQELRKLIKQTMRGYAGDDDGFIDDDTLNNEVIPNAIRQAIKDAAQYNDKI